MTDPVERDRMSEDNDATTSGESTVCFDYPDCSRGHAGGMGGVAVHPPVGARISGDEPIPGWGFAAEAVHR